VKKVLGIVGALLSLAVASPAAHASSVIGSGGKRGSSQVGQGLCKYGVFGPNGVLTVGVPSPIVSGANTRRRTRSERTSVRFRVSVTDAFRGYAPIQTTGWSAWIRSGRPVRPAGRLGRSCTSTGAGTTARTSRSSGGTPVAWSAGAPTA
jgi:hypothetical protein